MKSDIYDSLSAINQATEQIIQHIARLQRLKIVHPNIAEFRAAGIEEIRSHINHHITIYLSDIERDDANKFGKQRLEIQERLVKLS
jgi:hypothetical protein